MTNIENGASSVNNPGLPALNSYDAATMSSIEIAELVDSRHDKVKQSIERLAERGVIDLPPLGDVQIETSHGRKHKAQAYFVGKRDSYVVVAQLSPEFTGRLVDRWQELEQAIAAPATLDYSDPAVALGFIEHLNAKVAEKDAQLAIAAPKVEAYDSFINADGLYGLRNAGRALGAHPNKFTAWLKRDYLFYQGSALVSRVAYIQRGYFEVKATIIDDKARYRTWVTPKGLTWLRDQLPEDIRMGGA